MNIERGNSLLNLPNLLTSFRFIAAPALLALSWYGHPYGFLALLAVTFLTDILDGYAARLLNQETQLGAKLDSWADVVIYSIIAASVWWLWPEIVLDEFPYIAAVVVSFFFPALVGLIRFHDFTSYHTWSVKVAAGLTGVSLMLMFVGGPAWPFRIAAVACMLAALEELVITLLLREPQSNVRSLWFVLKRSR